MRTRTTTAALITAGMLLTLTACGTEPEPDAKAAGPKPAYKVTKQDSQGNKRNVEVEVDTTKGLKAVFDDVVRGLKDEAGYYVMLNCSTGGTTTVDNRLANGQYANGSMGAATTGLDEGTTEFDTNDGATCPAA
ncbi:hypothetical protein ACH4RG_14400 [Streptomyces sp. NPDC021019]|uniref:hypothetical protein n=1 Tax=Streptomyces sp. NPDC021019 TaxID=3365108 RepID=UPI0037985B76